MLSEPHQSLPADGCQTPRGAILIFLLLQLTHNTSNGTVGVAHPLGQYLNFLPQEMPLPTFWSEDERALLVGTSLEAALGAKLKTLDREFDVLRESTADIEWCKQHWWSAEAELSIDNWKHVDATYRSRTLDLPRTGHATVPCIDMANHASGEEASAVYETDSNGNAILVLRAGKTVKKGDEVTISYGDEKGACEMMFSYGFLEEDRAFAKELFLDLDIPEDDPLRMAKKAAANSPPGFRLLARDGTVEWESDFVWLLCINEEDGLEFQLRQTNEGDTQLCVCWKKREIPDLSKFRQLLEKDDRWDVIHLRAITTLQSRVESQLVRLNGSDEDARKVQEYSDIRAEAEASAMELRDLEETLMLMAYQSLEESKNELFGSDAVQAYLRQVQGQEGEEGELQADDGDDFS